MALINCPECNKEVSGTALKCPSCGFQLRKPKRGFFGTLIKWAFILFNILMIFWWFSYTGQVADTVQTAGSNAAEAGTLIGGTIGVGLIFAIWFFGDFILGIFVFLTRPKA